MKIKIIKSIQKRKFKPKPCVFIRSGLQTHVHMHWILENITRIYIYALNCTNNWWRKTIVLKMAHQIENNKELYPFCLNCNFVVKETHHLTIEHTFYTMYIIHTVQWTNFEHMQNKPDHKQNYPYDIMTESDEHEHILSTYAMASSVKRVSEVRPTNRGW